jgi:glycosyltransferase involved in cell wall biosynthesis
MPLKWKCPTCGYMPRLQLVFPFHCVCGSKYTAEQLPLVEQELITNSNPVKQFNLWNWVHEWLADKSQEWSPEAAKQKYATEFVPRIPSYGCSCEAHWADLVAAHPIDWSSREAASECFYFLHNKVSGEHAGKPVIPVAQARGIWEGPRVGFLAESYLVKGGTETFHRTLLPRLRYHRNVKGFVATTHYKGDGALLEVPYFTGTESVKELADQTDILVVWGHLNLQTILADCRPSKVIAVHHGDWPNQWSNDQILNQFDLLDEIVCVNDEVAAELRKLTTKPVHYIPNAVDPSRVKPTGKHELLRRYYGVTTPKLLTFGHRLSFEKRPLLAIEIAKALPDDWTTAIIGSGYLTDECRSAAAGSDRVKMIGPVNSLADWLATSDCFLSLATTEGFGLSIAEAMAAGVPVVSTPTGVAAGRAVTRPIDASVTEWVDAILESQTNPVNPGDVLAEFSIDKMVNSWANLLSNK